MAVYVLVLVFAVSALGASSEKDSVRGRNSTGDAHDQSKPFTNASVTCGRESIEILLPIDLVRSISSGNIVSPSYVMFRPDASEHCRAVSHTDETYRISVGLKSKFLCGSTVKEHDYQTEYRNEVVLLDADAGDIRSVYNLTCIYQDDERVILIPPSSSELVFNNYDGEDIRVDMNLYRDKSYSEESALETETPEISVGHFLFVSINLLPGENPAKRQHLHVISKNCFASYFASTNIKRMYHHFIVDGCADRLDSTVSIQSNGDGWKSRWKFQMFKWVNTTAQRIYLFCDVDICDETRLVGLEHCDKNKTKENCFGKTYGRRTRRELDATAESGGFSRSNMVSIGPIFPKDSVYLLDIPKGPSGGGLGSGIQDRKGGSEEPSEVVPAAVGVVLGVCVIVIAIAAYLTWRRHVAQRNERRERSKKEIQQGFAFAIKSSNDQNIFHSTTTEATEKNKQLPRERDVTEGRGKANGSIRSRDEERASRSRSRSRRNSKPVDIKCDQRRGSASHSRRQKGEEAKDESGSRDKKSKTRSKTGHNSRSRRHSTSRATERVRRSASNERRHSSGAVESDRRESRNHSRSLRHSTSHATESGKERSVSNERRRSSGTIEGYREESRPHSRSRRHSTSQPTDSGRRRSVSNDRRHSNSTIEDNCGQRKHKSRSRSREHSRARRSGTRKRREDLTKQESRS